MSQTVEVLEQAIQSIKVTNDCFYQGKNKEGYTKLNNCIGTIMAALEELNAKTKQVGLPFDINEINGALGEALQAMQAKDVTLLADILEYEICEKFEELKESFL